MENLSQKKIAAQGKKNELEKDSMMRELQYNNTVDSLEKRKQNIENNFKRDHESWKRNKEVELSLLQKQYDKDIAKRKKEIEDADVSLDERYSVELEQVNKQIADGKKHWQNFEKLRGQEITSIDDEINELNEAIASLKDISKESAKKE